MTPARAERLQLADTLAAVGPDHPTLCDGWATRDLAAHLVVRERRPDAAPGILVGRLARYTDKVQADIAGRDWHDLVALVRTGPPAWSPTRLDAVDRQVNTAEFFVHHEDVRRAADAWEVRELPLDLVDDLYGALRRANLLVRSSPYGIVLQPTDGRPPVVARQGEPTVAVSGPVGELVLWIFGRQDHAAVGYDGPAEAVDHLTRAPFGI